MKSIGEMLSPESKKLHYSLSNYYKKQLKTWAFEAYALDNSKSVLEYYNLFLNRLRTRYTQDTKDQFIANGILVTKGATK